MVLLYMLTNMFNGDRIMSDFEALVSGTVFLSGFLTDKVAKLEDELRSVSETIETSTRDLIGAHVSPQASTEDALRSLLATLQQVRVYVADFCVCEVKTRDISPCPTAKIVSHYFQVVYTRKSGCGFSFVVVYQVVSRCWLFNASLETSTIINCLHTRIVCNHTTNHILVYFLVFLFYFVF